MLILYMKTIGNNVIYQQYLTIKIMNRIIISYKIWVPLQLLEVLRRITNSQTNSMSMISWEIVQ